MAKLKIAVLFGGVSDEHNVSIKSAAQIAASIDTDKYEPVFIGINLAGEWKVCPTPNPEWESESTGRAVLSPDRATGGLLVERGGVWEAEKVDVIFPIIHGKMGEDGALQGLFELSGIPYVGCGITASASCMDKSLAYVILKNAGINTPGFYIHYQGSAIDAAQFDYPVFVKPARSGSSMGVNRVTSAADLQGAIDAAAEFDSKVLIEQAIVGEEIGSSVLGNGGNDDDLFVGELDQIRTTNGLFAPHLEADPDSGLTESTITCPAVISETDTANLKATAKKVYRALGCQGLARVDLFLQVDGTIVLNEINTLPGFTSYSRYPRMMAAAGISVADLIDKLIKLALSK